MKLQILQENLSKAVNTASRFASVKAQLPVLGNVLLSSKKTKIFVMSTNLEVSVSVSVGAKVEEDGDLCIPAKVLNDVISNLPKEPVNLESDKDQLKVASSGFSGVILGMSSADFPKVPNSVPKDGVINLPSKEFTEALGQVVFAASQDETRPVLTGVLVIKDKKQTSFVATDGFRLSRKVIKVEGGEDFKLILPKTILMELTRDSQGAGEFLFNFDQKEKQAVFGVGDMVLTSRLIEGEYPDFEKIIPKESLLKVSVDKEDFLRSVKLASIFAREAANIIKIKVLKSSIKLTAESSASGSQEAEVEARVEKESGESGFEISFNYRFLEEFLHSVKGDNILMQFSGVNAAGVFTDPTDSNYLHLIMPVRVQ